MDKNRGQGGDWRFRDHGLFICFAPVDNPRYAASVVIEHGLGGARAAAPVAKDVLTWLYDREQAMTRLAGLEEGWGGDITKRMAAKSAAWKAAQAPQAPQAAAAAAAQVPEDPAAAAQNVASAAANASVNAIDPDAAVAGAAEESR